MPKIELRYRHYITPRNTMPKKYVCIMYPQRAYPRRAGRERQEDNPKKKRESIISRQVESAKPALQATSRGRIIYAPLVCRLENLVLLFALMKLLLPLTSVSPLPLTSPLLPAVKTLPFLVATLPSSLLFSTTS